MHHDNQDDEDNQIYDYMDLKIKELIIDKLKEEKKKQPNLKISGKWLNEIDAEMWERIKQMIDKELDKKVDTYVEEIKQTAKLEAIEE